MSDNALPTESSRSDRDDELVVEPDDAEDVNRRESDVEFNMIDADLALREAGGDADRAEEILAARHQPHEHRHDVPADDRAV